MVQPIKVSLELLEMVSVRITALMIKLELLRDCEFYVIPSTNEMNNCPIEMDWAVD